MDDGRRREERRKKLREEHKKSKVGCRYKVKYPISIERRYQKLVKRVMQPVNEYIEVKIALLSAIIGHYSIDEHELRAVRTEKKRRKLRRRKRVDDLEDALEDFEAFFLGVELMLQVDPTRSHVENEIKKIARDLEEQNQMEWGRAVKETLGLEVPERLYYEPLHREAMEKWLSENTAWVSGIPRQAFSDIKGVAYTSYLEGKAAGEILGDMRAEYASSLKRNEALIINRVSNINTEITKQKHLDAGIHEYIWWTRLDERVRESHKRLHGRRFSWDDPPETDGGRHCHPGEDYGCRCIALPSFDLETIEL